MRRDTSIFQISQATGPFADPTQLAFFQVLAVEYPNTVNFRKIAAGSPAALRLHAGAVTKPVYVFCDPSKQGTDRFAVLDETQLSGDQIVGQIVLEGLIRKYLGVGPTLFAPFALTADNEHKVVYDYQPPEGANAPPTAKWIVVLFYPNDPKWEGRSNRLRVMLGIERFFYPSRLRFAEVDLGQQGQVYQALINNGVKKPLPTEPELWVIDPDTHRGVKFTTAKGQTLADLSHDTFTAWLGSNSLPMPADGGLNTDLAWRELLRLKGLQEAMPTQNRPLP